MSEKMTETGLTPGVYNNLNGRYRLAVEAQRIKSSAVQLSIQAMEQAGVNTWAAKIARQIEGKEPATGEANVRALLTYLFWSGADCMRQPSLFGTNRCLADMVKEFLQIPELTEAEIQSRADIDARQQGYTWGTKGQTLDFVRGKYVQGSSEAQMAHDGWTAGNEFYVNSKKSEKPAASEGRGRGKRGKETKAEQQANMKQQSAETVETDPIAEEVAAQRAEDEQAFDEGAEVETIDIIKAQNMTKPELAAYFNKFAELYGQKTVGAFESKAVGLQRLSALKARQVSSIRAADEVSGQ